MAPLESRPFSVSQVRKCKVLVEFSPWFPGRCTARRASGVIVVLAGGRPARYTIRHLDYPQIYSAEEGSEWFAVRFQNTSLFMTVDTLLPGLVMVKEKLV